MASKYNISIDAEALWQPLKAQFADLDPRDPSVWPALPRYGLLLGTMLAVLLLLWFSWLSGSRDALKEEQATEVLLRTDFQKKLGQAINLDVLKQQREQIQQYVTQLEKQLPSKAEMAALLSDINQAGLGRNLQFDWFRPGQVAVKEYYAELPISLKITGHYHDMGAFASDIANLSRIVTLNSLSIVPKADGTLVLDATAKTFRYLDATEVQAQRSAFGPKKK